MRYSEEKIMEMLDKCRVDLSNQDIIELINSKNDLINRQQETIETLRNCVEQHHIIRKDGKSPLSLLTEEIKAETIKEFAERLKNEYSHTLLPPIGYSIDKNDWIVYREDIEDLVKEMTEPSLLDKKLGGEQK